MGAASRGWLGYTRIYLFVFVRNDFIMHVAFGDKGTKIRLECQGQYKKI